MVNSPRFVDPPPVQICAQLQDEGVYLPSTSTTYRVLAENSQVRERRRLARHPARAILRTGRYRPWINKPTTNTALANARNAGTEQAA